MSINARVDSDLERFHDGLGVRVRSQVRCPLPGGGERFLRSADRAVDHVQVTGQAEEETFFLKSADSVDL